MKKGLLKIQIVNVVLFGALFSGAVWGVDKTLNTRKITGNKTISGSVVNTEQFKPGVSKNTGDSSKPSIRKKSNTAPAIRPVVRPRVPNQPGAVVNKRDPRKGAPRKSGVVNKQNNRAMNNNRPAVRPRVPNQPGVVVNRPDPRKGAPRKPGGANQQNNRAMNNNRPAVRPRVPNQPGAVVNKRDPRKGAPRKSGVANQQNNRAMNNNRPAVRPRVPNQPGSVVNRRDPRKVAPNRSNNSKQIVRDNRPKFKYVAPRRDSVSKNKPVVTSKQKPVYRQPNNSGQSNKAGTRKVVTIRGDFTNKLTSLVLLDKGRVVPGVSLVMGDRGTDGVRRITINVNGAGSEALKNIGSGADFQLSGQLGTGARIKILGQNFSSIMSGISDLSGNIPGALANGSSGSGGASDSGSNSSRFSGVRGDSRLMSGGGFGYSDSMTDRSDSSGGRSITRVENYSSKTGDMVITTTSNGGTTTQSVRNTAPDGTVTESNTCEGEDCGDDSGDDDSGDDDSGDDDSGDDDSGDDDSGDDDSGDDDSGDDSGDDDSDDDKSSGCPMGMDSCGGQSGSISNEELQEGAKKSRNTLINPGDSDSGTTTVEGYKPRMMQRTLQERVSNQIRPSGETGGGDSPISGTGFNPVNGNQVDGLIGGDPAEGNMGSPSDPDDPRIPK